MPTSFSIALPAVPAHFSTRSGGIFTSSHHSTDVASRGPHSNITYQMWTYIIVTLLHSSWNLPNERVDFCNFNVVQLLHCHLDHWLVGPFVNNEDEGVVVFNLFHGRLSGQRVLDQAVLVKPV